jgi:hypothetical protein
LAFLRHQILVEIAPLAGLLLHPCPILQYADDNLSIILATPRHVTNLKNLLDAFSAATGLDINFHKSMFVPIKMELDIATHTIVGFCHELSGFINYYGYVQSHSSDHSSEIYMPMFSFCTFVTILEVPPNFGNLIDLSTISHLPAPYFGQNEHLHDGINGEWI